MRVEGNAMHITKIYGNDIPQIDGFEFACDERVNLFIGPNASGKSTILRAIKRLHSLALSGPISNNMRIVDDIKGLIGGLENRVEYIDEVNYGSPGGGLSFGLQVSDDWPKDEADSPILNQVPFLYIPATRLSLPGSPVFDPDTIDELSHDAGDGESNSPLKHLFDTESGVFDGRNVELAIDSLRKGMIGDRMQQQQLRQALTVGYWCAQAICSEIISDFSPHPFVDRYETTDSRRVVHHSMGIGTNDRGINIEQPLYAGALSSGTQGTLLWIYALVLKMVDHYGLPQLGSYGWEEEPAILLIDEIENHLHPTWQRRVIPALLQHFPGLQIFATTHSPFVVAGLKAGQVHLIRRDGPPTTNSEDIVGWTADEILRNMMGVEEPTDQLTVDRANRLRQLREKEPLTAEEESELAELRGQVNEDLLSKAGQLGAQQERYADLMERFLLSRQSGPTQDGE